MPVISLRAMLMVLDSSFALGDVIEVYKRMGTKVNSGRRK